MVFVPKSHMMLFLFDYPPYQWGALTLQGQWFEFGFVEGLW